jgi:AcrR family transcriptional regulator
MSIAIDGVLGPQKRKRRTAKAARREILDAAKNRLRDEGPDGLRLKVIAKDVGISHSSIIHHFGSREGLLQELRDDAFAALARDLKKRLAEPSTGDPTVDFIEKVSSTLSEQGYGRLLVWQLMAGNFPARASVGKVVLGSDGNDGLLDGISKIFHERRSERAALHNQQIPEFRETRAFVAMCACTIIGEAVAGELLVRSAGLGSTPGDRKGFRSWFARQAAGILFAEQAPAHVETPENV